MCTLLILHRCVASAPLIAVANRDEFLARPSLPPAIRPLQPAVFCGLDEKEGGTWFGINALGLVVGLTNLTLRPPDPSLRSRGLLCLEMLAKGTAREVCDGLSSLPSDTYNPFNLVALDGTDAVRASYDGTPRVERLKPGVFATTNWPVGSEPDAKRRAAEDRVRGWVNPGIGMAELLAGLTGEARRHDGDGDPRASVCCHAAGYGTRASTIVALSPSQRVVHVEHADGAPCSTAYEDRSAEVASMLSFKPF